MSEEKEAKVEEPQAAAPETAEPEVAAPEVTKSVEKAVKTVMDLSAEERQAFMAEYVGRLSVLELSKQVKTLEEVFGVSAAPAGIMMAMPGAGAGDGGGEEEKSTYDVVLKEVGPKKIQVIKAVRAITSLGLKEAKALVDDAPGSVKEGLALEEAEKIKAELEEAGAVIELK